MPYKVAELPLYLQENESLACLRLFEMTLLRYPGYRGNLAELAPLFLP